MEAKRGHELIQLWNDHEIDITKKTSTPMRSRQMISSEQRVLQPENPRRLPDSKFLRALGTEDVCTAPPDKCIVTF